MATPTPEPTEAQLAAKHKTRGVRRAKATHEKTALEKAMSESSLSRDRGWFVDGFDFDTDNIKVTLTTKNPSAWPDSSDWVTLPTPEPVSGATWNSDRTSIVFDVPEKFTTWTTTTTLTPEMIDAMTGKMMEMPEPVAEVDLAVVCFRVRYFDAAQVYTYAATGVKRGKRRLWYVTGTDAPQGVTYDELLDWFSENGREIVEMWVATSWKKLVTDEEENE